MVRKANRPKVHDIRAMKARGQKISMLYVTTPDEAAAVAAGIAMLSIEGRLFARDRCAAAGNCFVPAGLPCGPRGKRATAKDCLRAAFHFTTMGGDRLGGGASPDIRKARCDNHIAIVAHLGLIPSTVTRTGWRTVGKTATGARPFGTRSSG